MGLAQKKTIEIGSETSKRRTRPRAARATDSAFESPAAALQSRLEDAWSEEPAIEGRWSARRSIAFMVLANSLFWVGLAVLVSRFFNSIA